jgi:hypothetical protein
MALRAKIRGKWRVVSPAMARVFRAKGVRVEDFDNPSPLLDETVVLQDGREMTERQFYEHLDRKADTAVAAKKAEKTATFIMTPAETVSVRALAPDEKLEDAVTSGTPISAFDISDEELERLTNPES